MNNELKLNPLIADLDGYRVHGFENDYIFSIIQDKAQYYELETLEKWSPLLGSVKNILDIGANIGNHTLYWVKHLQPEKIVSFEPFAKNYEALCENITDNNLESIVTAENLAVGESLGYVSVKSVNTSNLGATTFAQTDEASFDTVNMTSIDDYLEQHPLTVDFIKIDTEGFELPVLKGAKKTISENHPALWVEVSETSHAEVRAYLQQFGYVMIDIKGFNVLFLHQSKTDIQSLLDMDKIIDMMFLYLSKTNTYYSNYETAKRWLADEKEKSAAARERAAADYNALELRYTIEKEKSAAAQERAAADYNALELRYTIEKEERASAEMKLMQLEFYLQQREEESYELQRSFTQRIIQTEKKTLPPEKKTLPPIWYTMAGSRVGRVLCKLFRWYHESKRYFQR